MAIVWSLVFLLFLIVYKEYNGSNKNKEEGTELIQTEQQTKTLTFKQKTSQFIRIEILVLLCTTFFTYFNQTSLETVLIPFTEDIFGWNELHNSLLFCVGGVLIIFSYVVIRYLTIKFYDRFVLLIGAGFILTGLFIALIGLLLIPDKIEKVSETLNQTSNLTFEVRNSSMLTHGPIDIGLKALFGMAFLFDVFGLPAIAICSASLFTKLIDNKIQGLGLGVQRGVLGIGTILGPLFAGPFISRPEIIMICCFVMVALIIVFVLVTYKRLKPSQKK